MTEHELFDEDVLRRALRLDPDERPRLDARALARSAAAAEDARLARLALVGLALCALAPALALARGAWALVEQPALLGDPLGAAIVVALPFAEGVVALGQPATALALLVAAALLSVLEGREPTNASAS